MRDVFCVQGATFDQLPRLRTLQLHVVTPRLDSEADEDEEEAWVPTDTAEINMCAQAPPTQNLRSPAFAPRVYVDLALRRPASQMC